MKYDHATVARIIAALLNIRGYAANEHCSSDQDLANEWLRWGAGPEPERRDTSGSLRALIGAWTEWSWVGPRPWTAYRASWAGYSERVVNGVTVRSADLTITRGSGWECLGRVVEHLLARMPLADVREHLPDAPRANRYYPTEAELAPGLRYVAAFETAGGQG